MGSWRAGRAWGGQEGNSQEALREAAGGPRGVRLREREDMQEFRPVGGVGASGVLGMEEGRGEEKAGGKFSLPC